MMKKIAVGICTYKRNAWLNIFLDRFDNMILPKDIELEFVIVDNSSDAQAKDLVENKTLKCLGQKKIHYYNYLGEGIASVRNEVLRQIVKLKPDYIVLTDDDQYPCENWLYDLYTRITETDADVVTGPAITQFIDLEFKPLNVPKWLQKNSRFEGKSKRADGVLCKTASTNNVIFDAKILDEMEFWFDERYKKMTGEDIDFFDRIYALGHKILWCKSAVVYEIVDPRRCNLKFIWDRNFNNGYLKIFNKIKNNKFNVFHIFISFVSFFFFVLIFPISIICGLTIFFEVFGKIAFFLGSIYSLFKRDALTHYKD